MSETLHDNDGEYAWDSGNKIRHQLYIFGRAELAHNTRSTSRQSGSTEHNSNIRNERDKRVGHWYVMRIEAVQSPHCERV